MSDAEQPFDTSEIDDIEPDGGGDPAESDAAPRPDELDLDRIDADLAGVEQALRRLDDGTYWTDEVTGEPLAPGVLDADPTAVRNGAPA